jgi:hypothetical protein
MERPNERHHNIVGTKWIFKNKEDEDGNIVGNKERLVAQGFSQIKGLDYREMYALVARLEAIRILLAYANHHDFKLQQMDVKSAFLNSPIEEEVYVAQPPGFEDPNFSNHVYILHKALYGLKQAPRAWYECLVKYLEVNRFEIGKVDSTLFCWRVVGELFICQIYVDDIIFGSPNRHFCQEFSDLMSSEFKMLMMGELKFFLRFQIKQLKEGTFISQTKYTKDMLERFEMHKLKGMKTLMPSNGHLDLNSEGKDVDQKVKSFAA